VRREVQGVSGAQGMVRRIDRIVGNRRVVDRQLPPGTLRDLGNHVGHLAEALVEFDDAPFDLKKIR
jgi:hypothetical protein